MVIFRFGTQVLRPISRTSMREAVRRWMTVGLTTMLLIGLVIGMSGPSLASTYVDGPSCGTKKSSLIASSKGEDPLLSEQWGLRQIRAQQAWRMGTGHGATVAVIDTGIDLRHPDLAANIIRGLDLAEEEGCRRPQDRVGHGTFVSGIIAAERNNGIGVAGVAPDANLMPIRVARGDELLTLELLTVVNQRIARGIRWAVDHGADVINLSVSTSLFGPFDDAIAGGVIPEALEYAAGKNVVVVAAAGNTPGNPLCEYPAGDPTTICAAATTSYETPAPYSTFPVKPSLGIALRAPGGLGTLQCENSDDIWSTALPGSRADCANGIPGYGTDAGTSSAAPFVAGTVALLVGEGITPERAVGCLTRTARNPFSGSRGAYDPVYGYGIVDAAAALAACSLPEDDTRRVENSMLRTE